ncbi:hypothetical protein MWT85_003821 [Morganella morganii]|nr:hypothetical protein [Morganella morganii]EKU5692269.1 hypothetical protein [Morganella morganii]
MNSVVVFIQPKLITNTSSYWAMFYAAIFKALAYQKNIQFPLGNKSPQAHRGELNTPSNFLNQIKHNIQNHAFEYLMMDLLRSDYGITTRHHLVTRLLETCGITDFEYKYLNVYKMGKDSIYYENAMNNPFDVKIVAPKFNPSTGFRVGFQMFTHPVNEALTNYPHSDLLLIVSDGKNHTYGFLGEVEGRRGINLFRNSYWVGEKGKYATFGIGISDKNNLNINDAPVQLSSNIALFTDTEERVILNYSNITSFAKDYIRAINNMELCFNGQFANIGTDSDAGHEYILKIISDNWGNGSSIIINALIKHVSFNYDYAATIYNQLNSETRKFEFKPNMLILENSYCLHQMKSTS